MAKGGISDLYVKVGKELHSKKTLDNVPVRWRSAVDHPETQLAYITDEEAALLKQLDIHGSGVRYNHHIGPLGIPSYNGAGSGDSAGGGDGGTGSGGGGGGTGPGGGGGDGSTGPGGGGAGGDGSTGPGGGPGGSDGSTGTGGGPGGSDGSTGPGSGPGGSDGSTPGGGGAEGGGGGGGGSEAPGGDGGVPGGGEVGGTSVAGAAGENTSLADAAAGTDAMGNQTGMGSATASQAGAATATSAPSESGVSPSVSAATDTATATVSGASPTAGQTAGQTAVTGGLAELGDTGPQSFAATEAGYAPSSTATNVSGPSTAAALGLGNAADYASNAATVSSLAAAAANDPTDVGMPDIGAPDPFGTGTSFVGQGTGQVSISNAITDALAAVQSMSTVGSYATPGISTPAASVSAPVGNQAATVGYGSTPSVSPAANTTNAFAGMTGAQLSAQMDAMSQPGVASVGPVGGLVGASAPSMGSAQAATSAPAATSSAPAATTGSSIAAAAAGAPVGAPGRSASSVSVESFADPLTGAPVSVTNMNGEESFSVDAVPGSMSGIASIASNPITSAIVNAGLTAAVPGYGVANLASLGLTGTSLYGQGVSLATGQGLQTGGGIMGLASGMGQSGVAPSIGGPGSSVAQGGEGGGGGINLAPTIQSQSGEPVQYSPEVISVAPKAASSPYSFNIADFIAPPRASTSASPFLYSDYLGREGYRA